MCARRWPGRNPRHSPRLVEGVGLDSETGARVTAFVRHMDSPERQQQIVRTPLENASSQLADDSYVMRLRNTALDQPVLKEDQLGWILTRQGQPRNPTFRYRFLL
jgi:hypothetical protein